MRRADRSLQRLPTELPMAVLAATGCSRRAKWTSTLPLSSVLLFVGRTGLGGVFAVRRPASRAAPPAEGLEQPLLQLGGQAFDPHRRRERRRDTCEASTLCPGENERFLVGPSTRWSL